MYKLIFAIAYFILGLGFLFVIIKEQGKKNILKLIIFILAGLVCVANGVYWLLEYL